MNRRDFLKNIIGLTAVAATPKAFFDIGGSWQKRESGLYEFTDDDHLIDSMRYALSGDNLFKMKYSEMFDDIYNIKLFN